MKLDNPDDFIVRYDEVETSLIEKGEMHQCIGNNYPVKNDCRCEITNSLSFVYDNYPRFLLSYGYYAIHDLILH